MLFLLFGINHNIDETFREITRKCKRDLLYLYIELYKQNTVFEDIKDFTNLKTLIINDSCLNYFPSGILNLINLEEIIFKDCNFIEIPFGIGKLQSLESLTFRSCEIKSLPDDIIKCVKLNEIEFLNCPNLNLKDILTCLSKVSRKIDKVFFAACNISQIPDNISDIENINNFYFSGNNISEEEKNRVTSLNKKIKFHF
jgi:Leucine-rich repeat (LRR) protein